MDLSDPRKKLPNIGIAAPQQLPNLRVTPVNQPAPQQISLGGRPLPAQTPQAAPPLQVANQPSGLRIRVGNALADYSGPAQSWNTAPRLQGSTSDLVGGTALGAVGSLSRLASGTLALGGRFNLLHKTFEGQSNNALSKFVAGMNNIDNVNSPSSLISQFGDDSKNLRRGQRVGSDVVNAASLISAVKAIPATIEEIPKAAQVIKNIPTALSDARTLGKLAKANTPEAVKAVAPTLSNDAASVIANTDNKDLIRLVHGLEVDKSLGDTAQLTDEVAQQLQQGGISQIKKGDVNSGAAYDPSTNSILLKDGSQATPAELFHELGHSIYTSKLTDQEKQAFENIHGAAYQQAVSEGRTGYDLSSEDFADYMSKHLTGHDNLIPAQVLSIVKKYAPQIKTQAKDLGVPVNQVVAGLKAQTAPARAAASEIPHTQLNDFLNQAVANQKGSLKDASLFRRVEEKVNPAAPLSRIDKAYAKMLGVKHNDLPAIHSLENQYDITRSSASQADRIAREGGLYDVLRKYGSKTQQGDFMNYLNARFASEVSGKRNLNLMRDGAGNPIPKETLDKFVADYEQVHPGAQADAQSIKSFFDKRLQDAVDHGIIAPEDAQFIMQHYQNYVPLERVFPDEIQRAGVNARPVGTLGRQTILQNLEGSDLPLNNDMGTLFRRNNTIQSQINRNKLFNMFNERVQQGVVPGANVIQSAEQVTQREAAKARFGELQDVAKSLTGAIRGQKVNLRIAGKDAAAATNSAVVRARQLLRDIVQDPDAKAAIDNMSKKDLLDVLKLAAEQKAVKAYDAAQNQAGFAKIPGKPNVPEVKLKTSSGVKSIPIDKLGHGNLLGDYNYDGYIVNKDIVNKIKADIQAGKPIDPITVKEGQIFDGMHRGTALKELGHTELPVKLEGKGNSHLSSYPDFTQPTQGVNKPNVPEVVYHGTNPESAKAIREGGFNSTLGDKRGFSGQTNPDFTYVTPSKSGGRYFADNNMRTGGKGDVVESQLHGKLFETKGQMTDYEAMGKAQEALGVPYKNGKNGLLDILALKQALKDNGYVGIKFKDRTSNGRLSYAISDNSKLVTQPTQGVKVAAKPKATIKLTTNLGGGAKVARHVASVPRNEVGAPGKPNVPEVPKEVAARANHPGKVEMVPTDELAKFMQHDRAASTFMSTEKYKALKEDIANNGIQEPLQLNYGARDKVASLGEGNHRLAIAKELGIKYLPVEVTGTSHNIDTLEGKGFAKVPGATPDETDYIPSNQKPSEIGIGVTPPTQGAKAAAKPKATIKLAAEPDIRKTPNVQRIYNNLVKKGATYQQIADTVESMKSDLGAVTSAKQSAREEAWALGKDPTTGQQVIHGKEDGKDVIIGVTPEVARVLGGIGEQDLTGIMKGFRDATRPFRAAWTGLAAPIFNLVSAAIYDPAAGFLISKNGTRALTSPSAWGAFFKSFNSNSEFRSALQRAGAQTQYGSLVSQDMERQLGRVIAQQGVTSRAAFYLNPKNIRQTINALDEFSGKLTAANRDRFAKAAYDAAIRGGATHDAAMQEAVYAYNNVLPNFRRTSHALQEIDAVLPYTSASVAGTRALGIAIKRRPVQTVGKLAAIGVAPPVLLTLHNLSQSQGQAFYTDMQQSGKEQQLNTNYFVVTPWAHKDEQTGQWNGVFKVPVPPELRALNKEAWHQTWNAAVNNKVDSPINYATAAFDTATGQVSPVTFNNEGKLGGQYGSSNPIYQTGQILSGNNPQTGAPLTPDSLQDLPQNQQVLPSTSGVAKVLGHIPGVSPIKAQALLNQFGATGRIVQGSNPLQELQDRFTKVYGDSAGQRFFRNVDATVKNLGLNANEQKAFYGTIMPSKTDAAGNILNDKTYYDTASKATTWLRYPKTFEASKELDQINQRNGEAGDPLFKLNPQQQKVVLNLMANYSPGNFETKATEQLNPWIKDFYNARSKYFDQISSQNAQTLKNLQARPDAKSNPQVATKIQKLQQSAASAGIDPMGIKIPKASSQVQSLLDQVSNITDSKARADFYATHPGVSDFLTQSDAYQRTKRSFLGLPQFDQYPAPSPQLQKLMDEYSSLPASKTAGNTDPATQHMRRDWIQAHPQEWAAMTDAFDKIASYSLAREGALAVYEGIDFSQKTKDKYGLSGSSSGSGGGFNFSNFGNQATLLRHNQAPENALSNNMSGTTAQKNIAEPKSKYSSVRFPKVPSAKVKKVNISGVSLPNAKPTFKIGNANQP